MTDITFHTKWVINTFFTTPGFDLFMFSVYYSVVFIRFFISNFDSFKFWVSDAVRWLRLIKGLE